MRRLVVSISIVILTLLTAGIFVLYQKHKTLQVLVLYGNIDVRLVNLGFSVQGIASMPFQEGDGVTKGTLLANLDKTAF